MLMTSALNRRLILKLSIKKQQFVAFFTKLTVKKPHLLVESILCKAIQMQPHCLVRLSLFNKMLEKKSEKLDLLKTYQYQLFIRLSLL